MHFDKKTNIKVLFHLVKSYYFYTYFELQKESKLDCDLHRAAAVGNTKLIKKILDTGRVHVDCQDEVRCKVSYKLNVMLKYETFLIWPLTIWNTELTQKLSGI